MTPAAPEISLVDSRLGEECPDGDEIMAAWEADEKDRKEGRPEKANRIQYDGKNRIVAVKVRGRYRSMVETFSEPRGAAEDKAKVSADAVPDELPDAQDSAARRIDHLGMKGRLGREVCRVLELALGAHQRGSGPVVQDRRAHWFEGVGYGRAQRRRRG
ncbi:hypothetical protein ACVWZ3_004930 [Bradyrhizobium sp. i1.3.6]